MLPLPLPQHTTVCCGKGMRTSTTTILVYTSTYILHPTLLRTGPPPDLKADEALTA